MLQVKETNVEKADYILCNAALAANIKPKLGTLPSPDFSATLILKVECIGDGHTQLVLKGPGINGITKVTLRGLHSNWMEHREDWNCAFPLGVDMIITDNERLVALPRTTHVEVIS